MAKLADVFSGSREIPNDIQLSKYWTALDAREFVRRWQRDNYRLTVSPDEIYYLVAAAFEAGVEGRRK